MSEALNRMHRDIAVVCSAKIYHIRELVKRSPDSPLARQILAVLDETIEEAS